MQVSVSGTMKKLVAQASDEGGIDTTMTFNVPTSAMDIGELGRCLGKDVSLRFSALGRELYLVEGKVPRFQSKEPEDEDSMPSTALTVEANIGYDKVGELARFLGYQTTVVIETLQMSLDEAEVRAELSKVCSGG